jgi:hypothetical protein
MSGTAPALTGRWPIDNGTSRSGRERSEKRGSGCAPILRGLASGGPPAVDPVLHQVALTRGRTVQLTAEGENVMRNSLDHLTLPSR